MQTFPPTPQSPNPFGPSGSMMPVSARKPWWSKTWFKILIGLFVMCVLGCAGFFGVIIYYSATGPDPWVVPGNQISSDIMQRIRALDLLEPDERIDFFYSGALRNLEDDLCLVTDRHVILYSRDWDEPELIIPIEDIVDTSATYSTSWFEDSILTLTLRDGSVTTVAASMQRGGDKLMFKDIQGKIRQATSRTDQGDGG